MSAHTTAATLMRHEGPDVSVDAFVDLPRQRNGLRVVAHQRQLGDSGRGDRLRLGRGMRMRLLAAVQALLADPAVAGLKDAARLAAVVLYAKSRAPQGREDDNQTSIWGAELGRWLGMKVSTVHHQVLPPLRVSGALRTRVVTDAEGHPTGLDCLVMPLWTARKRGGLSDPLALSRAELATLLRLIEALFGPGWTPKGKEPIPPGLLAGRTGRGAATDRLGLLLMVLTTRASGGLQLCGGSVKAREGRGAATLARLLGCSPSGARKVLARLTEVGVVTRQRRATTTRMNGSGKVMLLPVARAHGRVPEVVQDPGAVLSQRSGGAVGDHASREAAGAPGTSGPSHAGGAAGPGDLERPGGAELHAGHASVVTPVFPQQLSCGFSGEGRGGEGRQPERVCVREDQAADGEDRAARSALKVTEPGPLRGEKLQESPADEQVGQRAAEARAPGRPKAVVGRTQRLRRVGLPTDLRLRVALGPVAGLWERLSGWQQDQVEAAAKAELAHLEGLLDQQGAGPALLADRLAERLEETGGDSLVTGPYGWLIRRGLVQRPACTDLRCDDAIRLDTGDECENCGNVIHLRRARRAWVTAEVDRELPGLGAVERRQVLEDRLREHAAVEAEDFVMRREQAAVDHAQRESSRAAAQQKAERNRAAVAAADEVRQALPCADCGQERSGGLCEACGYRRRTETTITEAGMIAAAWAADLTDPGDVAAIITNVRATMEADIETALQQLLELMKRGEPETDPVAAASALAFAGLQAVQQALPEHHSSALDRLGRTEEAEAEARRAYKTEQSRRWYQHNPTGADAAAAATRAADTARARTAEHLLTARLEQLRASGDPLRAGHARAMVGPADRAGRAPAQQ